MNSFLDRVGKTVTNQVFSRSTSRKNTVQLKSQRELLLMRESGRLVAQALDKVRAMIAPGVAYGEDFHRSQRLYLCDARSCTSRRSVLHLNALSFGTPTLGYTVFYGSNSHHHQVHRSV